jgi:hypothetical protein
MPFCVADFPAEGSVFYQKVNEVAYDADTNQDVKNRKNFAGVCFWYKIAEPNTRQSNGCEVKRIQPAKMLNQMIEYGTAAQHNEC